MKRRRFSEEQVVQILRTANTSRGLGHAADLQYT